ncbi:hypothetical protein AMK10_35175 [Streptomyces sp. CB02058]|nr:hypothetical protein AMK10_35175 [Streptomyces sp. CB02058]
MVHFWLRVGDAMLVKGLIAAAAAGGSSVVQAEAAKSARGMHDDSGRATFTNSQVLGSGSMAVTNNYDNK